MPKIFSPTFPIFEIPPVKVSDTNGDANNKKYWAARKSFNVTLKKHFYYVYRAKFKVTGNLTGNYQYDPFDIGDYCKGIITRTTGTKFSVGETKPTIENATIFTNMCGTVTSWNAVVKQQYRRTDAQSYIGANNISNVVIKKRNCYKDYDDNGNLVPEPPPRNPDTQLYDYTVTFESNLTLGFDLGFYGNYLDLETLTVWSNINFSGSVIYLTWDGSGPTNCRTTSNGNLTLDGKAVNMSMILGTPCSYIGIVNMSENWSADGKLDLV